MEKRITEYKIECFKQILIYEEKSSRTIDKYVRDIRRFALYLGNEEVTKEKVIQYKRILIDWYAPSSVNSMIAAINKFFKEMKWSDCIIKTIRVQRQTFREAGKELSREEYYRLLEEAKKRNDVKILLIMQTICTTGIRVGELQYITVEAVRNGKAIVDMKGKIRIILLPATLCSVLEKYIADENIITGSVFVTRKGNPLDRSNIYHKMKALCNNASVSTKKVFPHNLRHLFACEYYKVNKDISRLADVLGHSSVDTTRIYLTISGEEQKKEMECLHLLLE